MMVQKDQNILSRYTAGLSRQESPPMLLSNEHKPLTGKERRTQSMLPPLADKTIVLHERVISNPLPTSKGFEPSIEVFYGRIRFNSSLNALMINFDGIRVDTEQHIKNIRQAIQNIINSHNKEFSDVSCFVNYDGFTVDKSMMELYKAHVDSHLSSEQYKTVQRFTAKAFIQDEIKKLEQASNVTTDSNCSTILNKKYRIERPLDEGTYARVWLGQDVETNTHVAIKEYSKKSLESVPKLLHFFNKEVRILKKIKSNGGHINIAELIDNVENDSSHFLIMELCHTGSLDSPFDPHQQLSEQVAHKYFIQIVDALDFLHNKCCVVHRDLQLSNICLDINDNIKIIDFGVGDFCEADQSLDMFCGNSSNACPEMLTGKSYVGCQADVWSVGCCLYKMLTGYNTYRCAQKTLTGEFMIPLEEEEALSSQAKDLLNCILCLDKSKRYTLEDIKKHEWFLNGG